MTFALFQLLFALVLTGALTLLAHWRKALTRGGLRAAFWLTLVITFCGGLVGFLCVALTFLLALAAGKLAGKREKPRDAAGSLHAKPGGTRDAVQVLCNVGLGAVLIFLQAATDHGELYYAFGGAMAASLADTMASEMGGLSKQEPVDILSRKPVQRGMSGGVTLFGVAMSVAGALVIGVLTAVGWGGERLLHMVASVTAAGVFAALCDSVLGSLVQAKYRCPACGALTENPRHCGAEGELAHGARWFTNDLVNLCNNLIGAGVAYLLARL